MVRPNLRPARKASGLVVFAPPGLPAERIAAAILVMDGPITDFVQRNRKMSIVFEGQQQIGDTNFMERRKQPVGAPGVERRQFSDSRQTSRPEIDELAKAVDQYKLIHRRRFITFEELYDVMMSLGYHR